MSKGVDFTEIQSGNWNVAKPFTNEKILKWLVFIDEYQTIATFGYSELEHDIYNNNINLQNTARIGALKRLIHAISTLARNTKFALKTKEDKKEFDGHISRLKKINKIINKLVTTIKRGNKIIEIKINENLFGLIMDDIEDIMDDMNNRMNNADLIFTHTEEFDPKKAKEKLRERFVNKQ